MSLFGFTKKAKAPAPQTKSFISQAEGSLYQSGGNKPLDNRSLQAYLEASSRLDTVIRTTAAVASSAKLIYGKEDTKGKVKRVTFKQSDGLYMNDYQTESDFLFELFGTLLTYDSVLLIPEESKYPYRKGMIDWTIVPDDLFTIEVGKNQTIEKFIYTSTMGGRQEFKYDQCVYIVRKLTANNLVYAIPKLKSLMKSIENILGIHNYINTYVSSGGKNSIIASSDSLLSEAQAREVKKELNTFLNTNAPKAMILPAEKFTLNKVSDSLSTSGVLDLMTNISNEITKSFNMPLFMLGEYSSSSQGQTVLYANRTWFQIQVKPLFNTVGIAMTRYFRNILGVKGARISFDYSDIQLLEDDDTVKQELSEKNLKMGIFSLNEARAYQGLEELEDEAADLHLAPAYLLGQQPIAFETFKEDVARNANVAPTEGGTATGTNPSDGIPSGDGGANNDAGLSGRA